MLVRGTDRSGIQGRFDPGGDERPHDYAPTTNLPPGTVVRSTRDTAPNRIIGLDLGKAADYAALAVLERTLIETGTYRILEGETELVAAGHGKWPEQRPAAIAIKRPRYDIRHLHQWDIGTSYTTVVDETIGLIRTLLQMHESDQAQERVKAETGAEFIPAAPPILAVDHTGVGVAVVDQIRSKPCPIPLIAVTITSGQAAVGRPQTDDAYRPWTVPKPELVAPMLVAVQNQMLKVAPELELAPALERQMNAFRMKLRGTSTVSYEAEHERDHDDLVIAVSIAAWVAYKIDQQGTVAYL